MSVDAILAQARQAAQAEEEQNTAAEEQDKKTAVRGRVAEIYAGRQEENAQESLRQTSESELKEAAAAQIRQKANVETQKKDHETKLQEIRQKLGLIEAETKKIADAEAEIRSLHLPTDKESQFLSQLKEDEAKFAEERKAAEAELAEAEEALARTTTEAEIATSDAEITANALRHTIEEAEGKIRDYEKTTAEILGYDNRGVPSILEYINNERGLAKFIAEGGESKVDQQLTEVKKQLNGIIDRLFPNGLPYIREASSIPENAFTIRTTDDLYFSPQDLANPEILSLVQEKIKAELHRLQELSDDQRKNKYLGDLDKVEAVMSRPVTYEIQGKKFVIYDPESKGKPTEPEALQNLTAEEKARVLEAAHDASIPIETIQKELSRYDEEVLGEIQKDAQLENLDFDLKQAEGKTAELQQSIGAAEKRVDELDRNIEAMNSEVKDYAALMRSYDDRTVERENDIVQELNRQLNEKQKALAALPRKKTFLGKETNDPQDPKADQELREDISQLTENIQKANDRGEAARQERLRLKEAVADGRYIQSAADAERAMREMRKKIEDLKHEKDTAQYAIRNTKTELDRLTQQKTAIGRQRDQLGV